MEGAWTGVIDTVWFENRAGEKLFPCRDLGMVLVSHDCPSPRVRAYMVTLDGADGCVDLSDWAGEPLYQRRTVRLRLRDMSGRGRSRVEDFVDGMELKIRFSEQEGVFYLGRCVAFTSATRCGVTDMEMRFFCEPYRLMDALTRRSFTVSGEKTVSLRARRMSAAPRVTCSAPMTMTLAGEPIPLAEGEQTPEGLILTRTGTNLTLTGQGTATFVWRDGIL